MQKINKLNKELETLLTSQSLKTSSRTPLVMVPVVMFILTVCWHGKDSRDSQQWLIEHFHVWCGLQQKTEASLFLIACYLLTSTTNTMLFSICTYNGHASHSLHDGLTDWLTNRLLSNFDSQTLRLWLGMYLPILYVYCLTCDWLPVLYYAL